MTSGLLVINAGSSSVKFGLFVQADGGAELALRYRGLADGLGDRPHLLIRDALSQPVLDEPLPADADQLRALERILGWLDANLGDVRLVAAGHRIVHGGPTYSAPMLLTEPVLAELEQFCQLAPLHQPHNLNAVRAVLALRPALPQVACFDTAFHRQQPRVAQAFALPREYTAKGILRYGFHGLSYEYIAGQLPLLDPKAAKGRAIVAHLGNGSSMCAMRGCVSQASTMGFTALEGMPMGQRCGSIDPGVLLYLLQQEGMTPKQVEDLLYKRSGLLGVSGISADMRRLLESDSAEAREAVELYCYRAVREIGSLAAAIGGVDALVFTAGIGENAAPVRERICAQLGWLGVRLDERANAQNGPLLSAGSSRVRVWCIPTNEELMIARHTARVAAVDGGGR